MTSSEPAPERETEHERVERILRDLEASIPPEPSLPPVRFMSAELAWPFDDDDFR